MHKLLAICIFIFYYQQIAQSLQIYQLNPESDDGLLPSLKEIIQRERNEEIEYVNRAEAQKNRRPRPMGKSLFVKRIIPHGYRGSDYEYDSKLNTVFKPLMRFHVKKPIGQHEKAIIKDMEAKEERERKRKDNIQFRKGKNRFRKRKYQFRTGKDRFRKGKSIFRNPKDGFRQGKVGFREEKDGFNEALIVLVKKGHRNPHDLLRQIKNYINRNKRPQKKNKKRFRSLLGREKEDRNGNYLRNLLLQKSGEDRDPFGPGKIPDYLSPVIEPVEEPKETFTYPVYPFWNYWEYPKNILQDECKGNLIKMGNMCVNSIGHRKYLEPIKNFMNHVKHRKKSVKKVKPWKLLKSLKPQKLIGLLKTLPQTLKKKTKTRPRKNRKFQYKK